MVTVKIKVGTFLFVAILEWERAPMTCSKFLNLLPFRQKLIQARWSGEAAWIPLETLDLSVGIENQKVQPAPGELLFYPRGISETEILFPYGQTIFASKSGQLAGNHFLTIAEGREQLQELGHRVLWQGAQDIQFERCD